MRRLVFAFSLTVALAVTWTSAAPASAQCLEARISDFQTRADNGDLRFLGLVQQAKAADNNGDGIVCGIIRTANKTLAASFTDNI